MLVYLNFGKCLDCFQRFKLIKFGDYYHLMILQIMEDVSGVDFDAVLKPSSVFMTGNVITPTPEHLCTPKVRANTVTYVCVYL